MAFFATGGVAYAQMAPETVYKGKVTMEPNGLQQVGDSLVLDFDLHVQAGAVLSCEMMMLTPEMTDGTTSRNFPSISIVGEQKQLMDRRWKALRSNKTAYVEPYMTVAVDPDVDKVLHCNVSLPYEQWMGSAHLVINQEMVGCRNEFRLFTFQMTPSGGAGVVAQSAVQQPVAVATVATAVTAPQTGAGAGYTVRPAVAMVEPAPEIKHRRKQGTAYVDFPVNRSVVLPDFRRNPVELGKIRSALYEVKSDPDAHILGIFITGYASPEGAFDNNVRLAWERAYAVKDYVRNTFGLPDDMFTVNYIPEDWDGLKAQVQALNVPQKDNITWIIDNTPDVELRKSMLKNLAGGAPWNIMFNNIFPGLRRVEYRIDFLVRDYAPAEIRSLVGKREDMLSQKELFQGALYYGKGSEEYNRIMLESIPKYFPDDPVALSNAAAILITKGDLTTARGYLERAQSLPAAWNNLGAVLLMQGDLAGARALLEKAKAAGVAEADQNLRELANKTAAQP